MQATLRVSTNGTPQARPAATLALRTTKISKALKKGLSVGINASTKIDGVGLVAELGKTTIGQSNGVSLAAGQQVDVVKLSKAGKTKLRGLSTAKVSVTADIPVGSPSAKRKLKGAKEQGGGAGGNCTPGYSPCIPPGSDVDCAGGSGNGPRYVQGPIRVTGSDPYGLDSDGDGIGCET
jgi:hypothetical protein